MRAASVLGSFGGVDVFRGLGPTNGKLMRLDSNKGDFEYTARCLLNARGVRYDAGLPLAFARSLEHIMAKTYAALFAEYRAAEFFPVNTEVDPGALSFTYRMVQRIGNAQVVNAGNANDLPNIDLGAEEWPSPIITLGASYDFTVIDQLAAQKMQFALEAEKAKSTREAMSALEELVFCQGYAAGGVPGVTNAPGVAAVTQVSTGTWATQIAAALAATPTPTLPYPAVTAVAALAADIIAMKSSIFSSTLGRQKATDCLLPPNLYEMLDVLPRSPAFTDDTALMYLSKVTGLRFDYWPALQNAGAIQGSPASIAGGVGLFGRVMVYEKNPDVVQLIRSQQFVQLAPQPTGLVWSIPCYSRIGGAMAVRPAAIKYMDGL